MLKTIHFDPTKGKLSADIKYTGLIIASYILKLYSDDEICDKILQQEIGNNLQPHDDTFWIRNKSNENEPVENNDGRLLELFNNINTDKLNQGYTIKLSILQNDKTVDSVSYSGSISDTDGGQIKSLAVILKKL